MSQKVLVVGFEASEVPAGVSFANALGLPYEVLLLGADAPTADALAPAIVVRTAGFSHTIAVSSMASKDVMARVAGLLDSGMVTDVVAVQGDGTFMRPVVAGSAIAQVEVLEYPVVVTFRPSGFTGGSDSVSYEPLTVSASTTVHREKASGHATSRPDLTQAKVVVSGGRPLGDKDTFERVLGGLADKLGAALGATRAAVDSGIASNDMQVGQTGKIVAPDLYIACGISGSTQHMAGIKDSKVIVAINTDADAPVFEFADYGLVADLFTAVPELTSKLP